MDLLCITVTVLLAVSMKQSAGLKSGWESSFWTRRTRPPQQDYLVGLLDPKTPLEDNFIREVIKGVDLRSKSLMLLTANDPSRLNRGPDDPLWSRLEPTVLAPYTKLEMIDLAAQIVSSDTENPYQPTRSQARKLAKETLAELGEQTSFRSVLDRVNHKLFNCIFDWSETAANKSADTNVLARRRIGFKV